MGACAAVLCLQHSAKNQRSSPFFTPSVSRQGAAGPPNLRSNLGPGIHEKTSECKVHSLTPSAFPSVSPARVKIPSD